MVAVSQAGRGRPALRDTVIRMAPNPSPLRSGRSPRRWSRPRRRLGAYQAIHPLRHVSSHVSPVGAGGGRRRGRRDGTPFNPPPPPPPELDEKVLALLSGSAGQAVSSR